MEARLRFVIVHVGDGLVHGTVEQTALDQLVQQVTMATCQEFEPAPLVRFDAGDGQEQRSEMFQPAYIASSLPNISRGWTP